MVLHPYILSVCDLCSLKCTCNFLRDRGQNCEAQEASEYHNFESDWSKTLRTPHSSA